MKKIKAILPLLIMSVSAFSQDFDLQGHRGARGLLPENSLPSFKKALELGVTTIELDVVITSDRKVLVSHEPWFNSEICLAPDGSELSEEQVKQFNIFHMTYDEVQAFDCGSRGNKNYPEQEKLKVSKPLLETVITEVEKHIEEKTGYPVNYNIEIKSDEKGDDIYQPKPEEFSRLVYDIIDPLLPWERVIVQSFDMRVLRYWHSTYKNVTLSFLTENNLSAKQNFENLGFETEIYSPEYWRMQNDDLAYVHSKGIRLIPWTVNIKEDMLRLKDLGVDGLITDYPDRAAELGMTVEIPHRGKE